MKIPAFCGIVLGHEDHGPRAHRPRSLSIGSGEWLLGPQAIGELGWVGIGFVITISIILQAFYNVEVGRYVMATGEVPSLGFGRIPPGAYFGTILAIGIFYLAFLTGGWASAAGASAFTLFTGDIPGDADLNTTRWIAVGLVGAVFVITLFGQKISRTLELIFWVLVGFILITLLLAVAIISIIIFQGPSVELVQWAANMSNLAAMIFPFALTYLISKLPRPARAPTWSYVLLTLFAIYFGFWFVNFALDKLTGSPLVTF